MEFYQGRVCGQPTVRSLAPICSSTTSTLFSELFYRQSHTGRDKLRIKYCPVGVIGIIWVLQHCFLQLFVISIEVLFQSFFCSICTCIGQNKNVQSLFLSDSSLWFVSWCILKVFLSEHFYSHSTHWNSWSFLLSDRLLWFPSICLWKFFFLVDFYSHWVQFVGP